MKESAYKVKSISSDAVIACVIGGISIGCMLGALSISYIYKGEGPVAVGLMGIGSLLLSVSGMIFTVSAWKSSDGGFAMKRIAGIINIIPFVATLIFYILGWI